MIDRYALAILKPAAEHAARRLAARGLSADQVSLAGFAIGLLAALMIALGFPAPAIVPLLLNRALDGIDGAMARLSQATDRGAFIDIGLDFLFYAAIPLGFAFADSQANALAAAVLLAAFVGTGTSFLAYAVIAEKRGLKSENYPTKSFYYLGGLTEGAETIVAFLAMCWWPQYFSGIAYVYAAMCTVTTVTRLLAGWQAFGGDARS